MKEIESDYPKLNFDTWKCQTCNKVFQVKKKHGKPVACPYCGRQQFNSKNFKKYSEKEKVRRRKEKLQELKETLEQAASELEKF